MLCEVCGKDFAPAEEVERLMLTGSVARLCEACERQPGSGRGFDVFDPSRPFAENYVRTKLSVLHRVDRFESDGRVQRWMSLYPRFLSSFEKKLKAMPAHRQNNLIHPFVMSEHAGESRQGRRLTLKTNLWVYQQRGQPPPE